ncbi:MAG: 30S ribosomal protein S9 [Candidatus Bipolaricaulota bacterium]|nr:30S ribosomal protein S9 [Candidatus Bipolaricaulota bacterium]MBS3792496.1 30S ribosomal protein S9 [Candidatus Bipolaricaulota bacterium]
MAQPKVVDGRAHCVGKRKESRARVYLERGDGEIKVNGEDAVEYFQALPFTEEMINLVARKPFSVTNTENHFDVEANLDGGGYKAQLEALQHGIARAMTALGDEYKKDLKQEGLLTRDPRMVERKKIGKHKARRGQQFSKR